MKFDGQCYCCVGDKCQVTKSEKCGTAVHVVPQRRRVPRRRCLFSTATRFGVLLRLR